MQVRTNVTNDTRTPVPSNRHIQISRGNVYARVKNNANEPLNRARSSRQRGGLRTRIPLARSPIKFAELDSRIVPSQHRCQLEGGTEVVTYDCLWAPGHLGMCQSVPGLQPF